MACRQTGFAMLCSGSVQEAHDLAAIAHAATLEARVPFLHFFDGFRTSHEVRKIELLERRRPARPAARRARRGAPPARAHPRPPGAARHRPEPRRLLPGARGRQPLLPGPARDRRRRRWTASPSARGRRYQLFDYVGHPEAERVLVLMGSGAEVAHETVDWLVAARREGRRAEGAPLPAVLGRRTSSPALPRDRAGHRGARPHQGAGRARRAALPRRGHRAARGARREPEPARRAGAARGRRPLRAVARRSSPRRMVKAVFDELAQRRAPAQPLHRRHRRRRHPHLAPLRPGLRHRLGRARARRLLRARRRRHGGRQQELDQDHRRGDGQRRPGLLRLRLEEVGRHHDLAPALRPAADPLHLPDPQGELRGLPPVRLPREVRRARARGARRRPSC